MNPLRLSNEFLSDLRAVLPTAREHSISPQFLEDLAVVCELLREAAVRESPSHDELDFVSNRLEEWRSETRKAVESLIGRLPETDPLRCPISLFGTMDYGRLETAHTRALAWLLDPRKEHGFGSKLLEALLERVAVQRLPIQVHQVESELSFGQPANSEVEGRVDIFAKGDWIEPDGRRTPWLLVLEAKIDAWEGEQQLSRYEDWLDEQAVPDNSEVLRVFLAPAGRQTESARQDWFLLSFQELVETFRAICDELRDKPGYHYLRFYLAGVLRDVCGWPVPIRADCSDPYSVLRYLKNVVES